MLYQNPAIQSRVEVHLVEEAKGGPSKLLLSFLSVYIISLGALRGEITLLRAFPTSGPQSTFSLSTRCRRSDEVI
jgi:hypothetical protein